MKFDKELVRSIARNARIDLTEKELSEFTEELGHVINAFALIDKADTKDIEPSFHPVKIVNVYRQDVVEKSLSQNEALSNTSHKKDGFFKGPKTL